MTPHSSEGIQDAMRSHFQFMSVTYKKLQEKAIGTIHGAQNTSQMRLQVLWLLVVLGWCGNLKEAWGG